MEGLASVDKQVTLSQKITLSFQLDEVNFDNLASFLSGTAYATGLHPSLINAAYTLRANGGTATTATVDFTNCPVGRWLTLTYTGDTRLADLDDPTKVGVTPARARYGIGNNEEQVKVVRDPAGANVTLTRGTHYDVDWIFGRIWLKPGAVTAGQLIRVTVYPHEGAGTAADPYPAQLDVVDALVRGSIKGRLIFIQENAANTGHQAEFDFAAVGLKASGDLGMISDEFGSMTFEGAAEKDSTGTWTLRVTTHAGMSQPSTPVA